MNIRRIESLESSPVAIAAALVIIFAGAIFAKVIITPFLLAIFISIVCVQPISWLVKKRIPRWVALIIIVVSLVLLFSGFVFLIGGSFTFFLNNVIKYEDTITTLGRAFIKFLNEYGLQIPEDQISTFFQPEKIMGYTSAALKELLIMLGNTFLIFLIILFTLMEFGSFSVKARAIQHGSDKSIAYLSTILKNIRHYLGIKTFICLATGISIYAALSIIGVDYPLLWAVIAGLMNYVPNIGSIIATIPAVFFALVQLGVGGAFWTLAAFTVLHNVLGNFIEPRMMGKGMGLSALVVIISLLFWGFILGLVGMFLATPLTMTIKIVLEQNEKTRWIALLLGTPVEAEDYLKQKEYEAHPGKVIEVLKRDSFPDNGI